MLIPMKNMREALKGRLKMMHIQGYETTGWQSRLDILPESYDALIGFGKEIIELPMRKDFPYVEPNDLEGIRKERAEKRQDTIAGYISGTETRNKVQGGVFGRIAGCILGKPLECGWTYEEIKTYLTGAQAWPLRDYVPRFSPTLPAGRQPLRRDCTESMKGLVHFAQEDDDINYLILGLKVLEEFGPGFRTQDMGYLWTFNIPYLWNWGPEHSRYYLMAGIRYDHWAQLPEGKDWDDFVAFMNDGDELIGAMIRGDAFGLVNPGKPEFAAELAWRDARLSHGKTGVYSEMWVAATIAAAYHVDSPILAIQAGMDQLPARSRYTECLRQALDISLNEKDWEKAFTEINRRWGYLGCAGTLNESAAIINALVHSVDNTGTVDYEKVICRTVMHGWDTDCSGATAGCIAGVLTGYDNIPRKWLDPLNDTVYSNVATERERSISKLAERFWQMLKNLKTR